MGDLPRIPSSVGPSRVIHQAEALAWLAEHAADANTSVITSLPDVSELPVTLGVGGWRAWFVEAARAVLRWTPDEGMTLFYQSDVRRDGVWIDKSYLVQRAAEEEGAALSFHKIVCRRPPGTIALGRPSYSHLLGFSRAPRPVALRPGVDVLADAGLMPWSKAMGVDACRLACAYLRDQTTTRTVMDPFCGRGTVLAVANAMGFDAVGVELGGKRCRAARSLVIALDS